VRGDGHEAPLTVLADDELPLLADPVASGDDVAVLDVGVPDVEVVVIDVVDVAEVVPACVCAESAARAATASVPAMPDDTVSCLRNLSARSRSATVVLRMRDLTNGSSGGVFTHLRMSTAAEATVRDCWANAGNPYRWR
jgi:hypothetical protein